MDRTAPTFLPLDLNHVLGTAAAPISVDVRSADQISATGCFPSAGKVVMPSRRSVDAAHIPCFNVEKIRRRSPARRSGPFCDLFRDPCLWLQKLGQNRAMCLIKEKESEPY
jgi:hypothetical protein